MFDYVARPDLLADRLILITGAGRGIGAAAARAYAASGAQLILLGRTTAHLLQTAETIAAAGHGLPEVITLDLETATPNDYARLADNLQKRHGRLDGLLHNASLLGARAPLIDTPAALFIQTQQVNVNATFLLTQALLPLLKQSTDASVIFTSSSVGRRGRAEWGAYAVSKFATEGLMQVLADEVRDTTVRANSINPGGTRTDMRAEAYPDEDPLSRPSADAIMPVYLYLMGRDSQGVNGQALDAQ